MSASSAVRAARWRRWRRWASSLPIVAALLFATTTVAATVDPGTATGSGPVPLAVQTVSASAQQAAGQRPDIPVVQRGGSWTVAPDVGTAAWASARAITVPAGWSVRRQHLGGPRGQAQRETYQGRAPPGRRTPHALS